MIAVDNIVGIVKIEVVLGEVYVILGSYEEVIYWLILVFNRYEKLGEF